MPPVELAARAVVGRPGNQAVGSWEAGRPAFQAGEVRLMLPLRGLEVGEELLRKPRRVPAGAQARHSLALPCHVGGALADVAADHLQLGFPSAPRARHRAP